MKIVVFDKQNCISAPRGKSSVRISKRGTFSISKAARELLQLNGGDKINLVQDQENLGDWYIEKTSSDFGFELRDKREGLLFANVSVISKILKSLSIEENSVSYLIGNKAIEIEGNRYLFAIITRSKKK